MQRIMRQEPGPARFRALAAAMHRVHKAKHGRRLFQALRVRLMTTTTIFMVEDPENIIGFLASTPSFGSLLLEDLVALMGVSQDEYRAAIRTLKDEAAASAESGMVPGWVRRVLTRLALVAIRRWLSEVVAVLADRPGPELIARILAAGGGHGQFALRC